LKAQTRNLCRQLQDNPDTDGNKRLIKMHKSDLKDMVERAMNEMNETQGFPKFNKKVEDGLKAQKEFEVLKDEEKNYLLKIKKINEDDHNKRDINARDAAESTEEISKNR